MKSGVFSKLKGIVDDLMGENEFGKTDFGTFKVMMMLAAVDGDLAANEIAQFREMAAKCRGYTEDSFETLWEEALRSAGYLLLQSRFLSEDELVAAFVRESERGFVREVIQEVAKDREQAFDRLVAMAAADGVCSDIERRCLGALSKRVKEARDRALVARYPRAIVCQ